MCGSWFWTGRWPHISYTICIFYFTLGKSACCDYHLKINVSTHMLFLVLRRCALIDHRDIFLLAFSMVLEPPYACSFLVLV